MENEEKRCGTCFFWREYTDGVVGDCVFPVDLVPVPPWAARDVARAAGLGGWAISHDAGNDCRVWAKREGL